MMLNEAMQDAVNEQINNELFAMYSYLSMSAYCEHEQFTRLRQLDADAEPGGIRPRDAAVRLSDRPPVPRPAPADRPAASRLRVVARRVSEGVRTGADASPRRSTRCRSWPSRKSSSPRWWNSNGSSRNRSRKRRRPATSSTSSSSSKTTRPHSWTWIANWAHGNRSQRGGRVEAIVGRTILSVTLHRRTRLSVLQHRPAASAPADPPPTLSPSPSPKPPKRRISRYINRHASSSATSAMINSAK